MQVLHGAHVLMVVHAMAAVSAKTASKKRHAHARSIFASNASVPNARHERAG